MSQVGDTSVLSYVIKKEEPERVNSKPSTRKEKLNWQTQTELIEFFKTLSVLLSVGLGFPELKLTWSLSNEILTIYRSQKKKNKQISFWSFRVLCRIQILMSRVDWNLEWIASCWVSKNQKMPWWCLTSFKAKARNEKKEIWSNVEADPTSGPEKGYQISFTRISLSAYMALKHLRKLTALLRPKLLKTWNSLAILQK